MATYDFLHLFPLERYKQQNSNWIFFGWLPTYKHAGRWLLSLLFLFLVLRNFVSVLCFINVTVHRSSDKKYKQTSPVIVISWFPLSISCIILFFAMKNNCQSIVRFFFFSCSNSTSVSLMLISQVLRILSWVLTTLLNVSDSRSRYVHTST